MDSEHQVQLALLNWLLLFKGRIDGLPFASTLPCKAYNLTPEVFQASVGTVTFALL